MEVGGWRLEREMEVENVGDDVTLDAPPFA